MSNAKAVVLVWDILELMTFLHHNARSLLKRQVLTKKHMYSIYNN
jgi:hypothetical protein